MAMHIKMLLFAGVRERVGAGELTLELADGACLADARAAFERIHPGVLAPMRAAAAVNGRYERDERRPLRAGDEVAWLPPVSGG